MANDVDMNHDDKRLMYDPYYKDIYYNSSCTHTHRFHMNSLIRN